MERLYPRDLLNPLKKEWNKVNQEYKNEKDWVSLPSDEEINEILEISYHASFLTEEDKNIQFSLVINDTENINSLNKHDNFNIIKFETRRKLEPIEISKLAHATKIENTMIGVIFYEKTPYIWGLINIGDSWHDYPLGLKGSAILPPNFFTVTVQQPGTLNISRYGLTILRLSNGYIDYPITNCFSKGPIKEFLEKSFNKLYEVYQKSIVAEELMEKQERIFAKSGNQEEINNLMIDYESELYDAFWQNYIAFLKGILYNIHKTKQGGSLLILDSHQVDQQLKSLKVKYRLNYDEISEILLKTALLKQKSYSMKFLSFENETPSEKFKEFNRNEHELEKWSTRFKEMQEMIASFSLVDGTIVMDNNFNLLGFGAIVESMPEKANIYIANNEFGHSFESISSEIYGTRHRSIFRFCSNNEKSLAFIFSKDGGIKVVTQLDQKVTLWKSIDLEND